MPRRSPFTRLCQVAAQLATPCRVDLHTHTTTSDGDFTPSQLVAQARATGLSAIAITDHDTTAGLTEARATLLSGQPVEIIAGVEISTHFHDHGYHLLAYFIDDSNANLQQRLSEIRARRRQRFERFLAAFQSAGIAIPEHLLGAFAGERFALGRRHLAKLLVAAGHANTLHIAFQKYILPLAIRGEHNAPFADAVGWIHEAGGVASLAHPPAEITIETLQAMHSVGLDAIEMNCPSVGYEFGQCLAEWARPLGLLATAGSDYHGTGSVLGSRTLTFDQLTALRERAARSDAGRM